MASMALLPSKEFETVGYHSSASTGGRARRGEVVAADHGVAEAVAGQALAGAVADVLEPGVAGVVGQDSGDSMKPKWPPT